MKMGVFACFVASSVLGTALAQAPARKHANGEAAATAPVAYLYFTDWIPGDAYFLPPGEGRTQIEAYSVAADGQLTKIPGAPFAVGGSTTQMCANGKYLFAATHLQHEGSPEFPGKMNSYKIGANGALTLSHVLGNSDMVNITLDHNGETLYGQKDATQDVLAYNVRWSDGGLEYVGQVNADDLNDRLEVEIPITFASDNKYAFGTAAYSYLRAGNGELVRGPVDNIQDPAFMVTADPNMNLAGIINDGVSSQGGQIYSLASYQVAADGTLTTKATAGNALPVNTKEVETLNMSPDGKLLAVGGLGDVLLYHWNGASPPTHSMDLPLAYFPGVPNQSAGIPGSAVLLEWDNANHLYAYVEGFTDAPSAIYGYLYIWNVTESGVTSAPGSPLKFYGALPSVSYYSGMAVQSLTEPPQ
jgi:hypothetical protein